VNLREEIMLARPGPSALASLIEHDGVEANRNLFCPHYDDCLDVALLERWTSWTCAECTFFAVRHEAAEILRRGGERPHEEVGTAIAV
jgi:hypothetical protein